MENNFDKISPTAVACARIRAEYADMPYAREIYQELKKKKTKNIVNPIFARIASLLPSMKTRFAGQEIRYLSTNDAISRVKPDVIIEIAAGFSPRGLEMAGKCALYIEADLPEVMKIKKEIVASITKAQGKTIPANHILLEANPLNYNDLENIGQIIRERNLENKSIAIIQEGLMTYFSKEEQNLLRENIARFLKSHSPAGYWITPDLSYKKKSKGVFALVLRLVHAKIQRQFNFFSGQQEIEDFLAAGGLKGEALDNSEILDHLTSVRKNNLDKEKVKLIAQDYRACIIRILPP